MTTLFVRSSIRRLPLNRANGEILFKGGAIWYNNTYFTHAHAVTDFLSRLLGSDFKWQASDGSAPSSKG